MWARIKQLTLHPAWSSFGPKRFALDTWTNAYIHAQPYEQLYLALADQCELAPDDAKSDSEADDADEDSE